MLSVILLTAIVAGSVVFLVALSAATIIEVYNLIFN